MGKAAAQKLIEAGFELVVFDPIQEALLFLEKQGAKIAQTPREVAEKTQMVFMLLPGPVQVEECVLGPNGLIKAAGNGYVIVDMSTVAPETSIKMSEAVSAKGVEYVDAPVLGRPASVGQWCLPAGGSQAAVAKMEPVAKSFAAHVCHIGESGSGNTLKLLNQLMFGAINAMTGEMMAIADKMGVSPTLLYDTIILSQAGTVSNLFKDLGRRISDNDYSNPTFSMDLLIKDIHLGIKMASQNGAPPLLARTIEYMNELSSVQGFGQQDTSVMWKTIRGGYR